MTNKKLSKPTSSDIKRAKMAGWKDLPVMMMLYIKRVKLRINQALSKEGTTNEEIPTSSENKSVKLGGWTSLPAMRMI